MRRVGNLMPRILHFDNLCNAFLKAARGKQEKETVKAFREHLDERLEEIRMQLSDASFKFDHYHFFTIYDPKKRLICAAPFPARVVFHALMNVCEPVLERWQIHDSYACRKGKGTYKALERARFYAGKYQWFVKLDVRKFFDSINHEVLKQSLARLFKDSLLLRIFCDIIDSHCSSHGQGLPMGNLTSQYFANHYMAMADHYAKEQLGAKAMVRYMDDILFFHDDKEELKRLATEYMAFLSGVLKLQLHPQVMNRTVCGVPYLGYVVYKDKLRLNQRSRKRFRQKVSELDEAWLTGRMAERECTDRMQSALAFVQKADTRGLRENVYLRKGCI